MRHFKSVPWVCPINAGNECLFSHFPFEVFWLAYFVLVKAEAVSQLALLSGYSDPPSYYETLWRDTRTSSPHLGIAPEAPEHKLRKFSHNKERESLATNSSFTSDSRLTPTECFGLQNRKKLRGLDLPVLTCHRSMTKAPKLGLKCNLLPVHKFATGTALRMGFELVSWVLLCKSGAGHVGQTSFEALLLNCSSDEIYEARLITL